MGLYPLHYRAAFASSTIPPRTPMGWPYGSLARVSPGEGTGLPVFNVRSLMGHVGPTRTPVARHLRWATLERPTWPLTVWSKPISTFGLFAHNDAAVVCMC